MNKCSFKDIHLDLTPYKATRDNIDFLQETLVPRMHQSIDIHYVNEPFLLQNELQNKGVNSIFFLPEANESVKLDQSQIYIFEDDGRLICVSQKLTDPFL